MAAAGARKADVRQVNQSTNVPLDTLRSQRHARQRAQRTKKNCVVRLIYRVTIESARHTDTRYQIPDTAWTRTTKEGFSAVFLVLNH